MERTCTTCDAVIDDITVLVTHECERILSADDLTRRERNTLMYVESRVVDHQGILDHRQMNYEDQQNMKVFKAAGILQVDDREVTTFTDAAWDLARDCRQMQADDWIDIDSIDLGDVPGK